MAPKQHPFLAKSPEAWAANIRPAEAFSYVSCPWDPAQGNFRLTVCHYDSKADVKSMVAIELMMAGMQGLQERDANHHWSTYRSDMATLVDVVARGGQVKTAEPQHETSLAVQD